eukprot:1186105-Prorocentrum_minimum.AAC.4
MPWRLARLDLSGRVRRLHQYRISTTELGKVAPPIYRLLIILAVLHQYYIISITSVLHHQYYISITSSVLRHQYYISITSSVLHQYLGLDGLDAQKRCDDERLGESNVPRGNRGCRGFPHSSRVRAVHTFGHSP